MNKGDFRGFKQVFLFEFMTGIKKTSFKVFLLILCAMAFFVSPILILIGNMHGDKDSGNGKKEKSSIESVYVYDETDLLIDYDLLRKKALYKEVSFIKDNKMSYEDASAKLKEDSNHNNLVIKTEYDKKNGFDVTIVTSKKSDIKDSELTKFQKDYSDFYRAEVLKNLDVSKNDYEYLSKDINVEVMTSSKNGTFAKESKGISMDDYFIMIAGLMVVFMLINMSASNVATSIATEKSSRVIEFLLTGTRPLALLFGKISARLLETLITTVAVYSSYYLSQIFCLILEADNLPASGTQGEIMAVASIWETITISKLLIAVVYFLAGLILFSIIGALTGASVSKLDELQDAFKTYSFFLVACVYVDMFLIIMMLRSADFGFFQNFCAICPITGAFITPALVLTGKISTMTGFFALMVIIITVVVVYIFAAAVYESMLLYQGKRLKIKDVVTLMKKQVVE